LLNCAIDGNLIGGIQEGSVLYLPGEYRNLSGDRQISIISILFYLTISDDPHLMNMQMKEIIILPSEARGGIRGVALHGCPQENTPPAFCLQHP
jgi:hypothetical protein